MSEIDISSLTNTQKTAISMLCTVATEYERKDPLFKDEKAIEVKKNLVDLDFKAHLREVGGIENSKILLSSS